MKPAYKIAIRILWVALRLAAVVALGKSGSPFFYQGF